MVIVGDGTVVSAGMELLLRDSPRIELTAVRRDGAEVLNCIRTAEPEVIVVPSIGATATGPFSIEELLRECPSARVVVLRFEQSSVDAYHAERVEYATVTGFLSAIEGAGTEQETNTPPSDVPPSGAPCEMSEGR